MKTHVARLTKDELEIVQMYRKANDEGKQYILSLALTALQFSDQTPDNVIDFVEYLTKAI